MGGDEEDVVKGQRFADDAHWCFSLHVSPCAKINYTRVDRVSQAVVVSNVSREAPFVMRNQGFVDGGLAPAVPWQRHESVGVAVRRSHRITVCLTALALTALAAPASAVLYKWTDANGRVVYSDQAPPGDVKVEIVAGAPAVSNPNAAKELAAKEAEFKKRQTDAAEKEKQGEAKRLELAKRADQCRRAQMQITQLSQEMIELVRYNEKGEAVVVDPETRRKERSGLEAWVKSNCA
jgi:hypothetical protein